MRTYGRVYDPITKAQTWVEISTDANGGNDYVYVTALAQTLKLNLNESPFYGNFGIPARTVVAQQLQPDYYISFIQNYYAPQFASLLIAKQAQSLGNNKPVYNISAMRNNGSLYQGTVAT